VAQEQFKNRLSTLVQNEGIRIPALKKQIAESQGTLKMTMATLTTENMNRVSEINAVLERAKADQKSSDAAADSTYKLIEAATKAAEAEIKEKCTRMETRAKSLEKYHIATAQQHADSITARAKEIMDTGLAQASNAKDTQLKAAQARFLADKGILEQEKSTIDMKITELAAKNAAEMAKEKSFRKLEDVRIDGVRQKMERLRVAVMNAEVHLRNKLKHAAELQKKAVNMESKEKVQPDVVHQIISNIKSETLQAISMNKGLKLLKEREKQASAEYANIQDKVFEARARRGDKAREMIATVENTKAKMFSDIHTETNKNSEELWAESENGLNQIRAVISSNADSRKRGEHLTGPLNTLKEHVTTLLTNSKSTAAMDQALALGNTASPSSAEINQRAAIQSVGAKPEMTLQPSYPIKPVEQAVQDVPEMTQVSTAVLMPQAANNIVAPDGISVPI
jgi:chromosome segregation ATPase